MNWRVAVMCLLVCAAGYTIYLRGRGRQEDFRDVPSSAYYYQAVNLLTRRGVTSGCGDNRFCPDGDVTRAQMAVFLGSAVFGNKDFTYSATPHFVDVQPGDFAFKWIQAMFELGIPAACGSGRGDNRYCPYDLVTREAMAELIIAARFGAGTNFTYPEKPYFSDVPATDPGFRFVQRLKVDGITGGCGGSRYCPGDAITRGQTAVFITTGLFNELLPPGTPVITQIDPATLGAGSTGTFTITGSNTSFVQGTTVLSPIPGVVAGAITVKSPTSMTVELTAMANANRRPYSIVAITRAEEDVLPNGLAIR
jgi:S-layer homology domain